MYRRFQNRFGTAGVIVAVVALIAALSGTALAASGALTGKQKKEVEKIAKKYAGKPGAPGAAGANGTNGKDGAPGTAGAAGKDGTNGTNGTPGAPGTPGEDGKSVVATTIATGNPAKCAKQGGATYEVEESGVETDVCNGKEGSPWTVGGTLPPGATETGVWAFAGTEADTAGILVPVSFPIPIGAGLDSNDGLLKHVQFEPIPRTQAFADKCRGGQLFGPPKAKPGELCVYQNGGETVEGTAFLGIHPLTEAVEFSAEGASPQGAVIAFGAPTEEIAHGSGIFMVTGCSETEVGPNACP